jgi:hypothetical protein
VRIEEGARVWLLGPDDLPCDCDAAVVDYLRSALCTDIITPAAAAEARWAEHLAACQAGAAALGIAVEKLLRRGSGVVLVPIPNVVRQDDLDSLVGRLSEVGWVVSVEMTLTMGRRLVIAPPETVLTPIAPRTRRQAIAETLRNGTHGGLPAELVLRLADQLEALVAAWGSEGEG